MSRITLTVEKRDETGKGPSRRLRAAGKVPAIFYGKKTEPVKIAIDTHDFKKAVDQSGTNPLFDLQISGEAKGSTRRALLKDRQIRPWDGTLVHLDFLEVFMDESIEVTVPLEFQGKPVGLDKGGVFHVASRELAVSCLPDDIPDVIKVDVSGLDIGHSLHVSDITLPKGVSPLGELGVALATVAAPKKEEVAEEEVAEAAPTEEAEAPEKTETS
jgi:large subunit ribosomal protein L25